MPRVAAPIRQFAEHVLVTHADKVTRENLDLAADICLATADLRQMNPGPGRALGNVAVAAMVDLPSPEEATGLDAGFLADLQVTVTDDDLASATKEFVLASDAFIVALKVLGARRRLPKAEDGTVTPECAMVGFLEAAQILRELAMQKAADAGALS